MAVSLDGMAFFNMNFGRKVQLSLPETENQQWQELMRKLNSENSLLQKQNSENREGNIQALKHDLRKTKELLQSEKEKVHIAQNTIEEC